MIEINDTAKNIPYHGEGISVIKDETQLLLGHLGFIKNQLIRELIDYNAGDIIYSDNELPSDLTSDDPLWMNIEYDNKAYVENEVATGVREDYVEKHVSIGGVIQQYKNIGLLDNKGLSRKEVLRNIKKSGQTIYQYKENYENEGQSVTNVADYQVDPNMKLGKWDVGKAIRHLVSHASSKSQHACAKFVRMAMEAGGLSTAGRPNAAQDYHLKHFLPKIGFSLIATLPDKTSQSNWTAQYAQPGDVSVMQAPTHNWGHICMWSGKQWISDFIQNHMRPYASAGMHTATCWIYRYQG